MKPRSLKMRGLRALVFVHTREDAGRMFLGTSTPGEVRDALVRNQPWLDTALAEALWPLTLKSQPGTDNEPPERAEGASADEELEDPGEPVTGGGRRAGEVAIQTGVRPTETSRAALARLLSDASVQWNAAKIVEAYSRALQAPQPAHGSQAASWLQLPPSVTNPTRPTTWEHASWITLQTVTDGFLKHCVRREDSVLDEPLWSDEDRMRAVLRRTGPFIAILDSYPAGRFSQLIDRNELVERAATVGSTAQAK